MTHVPQADSLFREVFALPLVARQFLSRWLPREFLELVDWSSLRIERISGMNAALAERQADVVYRVKAGGAAVWFYLLIEHQSAADRMMPLRVLEYTTLIWQEHRRGAGGSGSLPLVVPVVLYPGPGRWTLGRRLHDLIEIPATIREWANGFAPDGSFLVVELGGLPVEELANGDLARALLGALQAERVGKLGFAEVGALVERLFAEPEREQALSIAQHLWTYLLHRSELKRPEIDQIVAATIPEEEREAFMSTAEMLRMEGRQEGRREEAARLVLRLAQKRFPGLSTEVRDTVAGLSIEQLEALSEEVLDFQSVQDLEGWLRKRISEF